MSGRNHDLGVRYLRRRAGLSAARPAARRAIALAVFASFVCALAIVPARGASASSSAWPGYRKCGSFQARYRIHVYARHVSCQKAMRVEREYWLAPESEKELVGPDSYNGYVRLKRFPGWKCTSGAMAGGCRKGRKEASYSTYNPHAARRGPNSDAGPAVAPLRSSSRPCGSVAIDYTPVPGEHYSRMYIKLSLIHI